MLYREIIAVCSQIHIKHINTLCGQNVELLNVKPGGTYSNHLALDDWSTVAYELPNLKFWTKRKPEACMRNGSECAHLTPDAGSIMASSQCTQRTAPHIHQMSMAEYLYGLQKVIK